MIFLNSKKMLSTLTIAIWVVQLLAEVLTFGIIWQLDMLPGKYLIVVVVLFALMWLLTGGLFFLGKKKSGNVRRVTALVLAVLIVLGCAGMSSMVSQLNQTMGNVTGKTEITTLMTVYVRADDPAQEIQDAAGYTFAVMQEIGADKTQKALETLRNTLGVTLSTVGCPSATQMVDALYSGEADAILMSSAYAGMMDELDGYSDFETKTKVLYEVPIVEQASSQSGSNTSGNTLTDRPVVGDDKAGQSGGNNVEIGSVADTPFLVYLSGSDTRSTTLVTSRSDVNILAVVNPKTKQVLLINTPRDYYVVHPYSSSGSRDKLTHLGNDGIDCSVQGLETLYNERVDFYAQINFTGFETLIDAIGGITVYFESGFTARGVTPIYAGDNYLTGSQALDVARDRYSFSDGDNARGRNQMKIIKAVLQKLASGAIITNYSSILDSLEGMFVTNMSMNDISKLVKMQLNDMASWNIQTYAVTGAGGTDYTYSAGYAYVMYPDQGMVDYGTKLIDRVLNGDILTEADVVYPG